MGFDFQNFGIGLLTGWATAYGVYRARHRIGAVIESFGAQATNAQNFATRSTDARYVNDLAQLVQANHLAGRFFRLTDVLVEPRFLAGPTLVEPDEDDVIHSVFHVVPQIHDFPYLHAHYNLETLTIDDLALGERSLVLLGAPGSGRTTALMAIALRSLGMLPFEPPEDRVQKRIDDEDAKLSDKQRAVRIKERVAIEQRAKERFAEEKGMQFDAGSSGDSRSSLPLLNRLMPVYIHLADIVANDAEFDGQVDPAEPLVRAMQRQVGRITASTIPRNFYSRLSRGQVLLLVDGYDDLPASERGRQLNWLQALMNQYDQNFYVVAGPVLGYGPLVRLGLTPIYMRPWTDLDINRAVDRWAKTWQNAKRGRRNAPVLPDLDEQAISRARTNSRALSPYDLIVKIWGNFAQDSEIAGTEGWLRSLINRHLPEDQSLGLLLPQLALMGAMQLDEGYITQARLEELVPQMVFLSDAGSSTQPEVASEADKPGGKGRAANKKEDTSAQARLLAMLRRSGLIVRYRGGRYQFRHASLAAYLASLTLKEKPSELPRRALDPNWNGAVACAALHMSIEDVVRARLNAPPDVLHIQTLELARWLAYAGSSAVWRSAFLKYVGNMFVAPAQFPLLRERAAAALVATRDKSVTAVFRQTLRSQNSDLRRLACLGLGAVGDPEVIGEIVPMMQDENTDVQLAAGLALGAVGTNAALEALVEGLTEGSERLRQAAAETFAAIPDEGYPILYDAIQDQDMMLRRAAVFGLKRVPTTWSLISIYRIFLEDEQWYVRSAAQLAFFELQQHHERGVKRYPSADSLPWLAQWAAQRGQNVPKGDGANQVLMRALQEGEPDIKRLSSAVIGQLGLASVVKPLYGVMRERQPELRDAAYRSLADLQRHMGYLLPAPA